MELGKEISLKVKKTITKQLQTLDCYVDDELPEYIMVMIANKRSHLQMVDDLNLFLNEEAEKFVSWLEVVLSRIQKAMELPDIDSILGDIKGEDRCADNSKKNLKRITKGGEGSLKKNASQRREMEKLYEKSKDAIKLPKAVQPMATSKSGYSKERRGGELSHNDKQSSTHDSSSRNRNERKEKGRNSGRTKCRDTGDKSMHTEVRCDEVEEREKGKHHHGNEKSYVSTKRSKEKDIVRRPQAFEERHKGTDDKRVGVDGICSEWNENEHVKPNKKQRNSLSEYSYKTKAVLGKPVRNVAPSKENTENDGKGFTRKHLDVQEKLDFDSENSRKGGVKSSTKLIPSKSSRKDIKIAGCSVGSKPSNSQRSDSTENSLSEYHPDKKIEDEHASEEIELDYNETNDENDDAEEIGTFNERRVVNFDKEKAGMATITVNFNNENVSKQTEQGGCFAAFVGSVNKKRDINNKESDFEVHKKDQRVKGELSNSDQNDARHSIVSVRLEKKHSKREPSGKLDSSTGKAKSSTNGNNMKDRKPAVYSKHRGNELPSHDSGSVEAEDNMQMKTLGPSKTRSSEEGDLRDFLRGRLSSEVAAFPSKRERNRNPSKERSHRNNAALVKSTPEKDIMRKSQETGVIGLHDQIRAFKKRRMKEMKNAKGDHVKRISSKISTKNALRLSGTSDCDEQDIIEEGVLEKGKEVNSYTRAQKERLERGNKIRKENRWTREKNEKQKRIKTNDKVEHEEGSELSSKQERRDILLKVEGKGRKHAVFAADSIDHHNKEHADNIGCDENSGSDCESGDDDDENVVDDNVVDENVVDDVDDEYDDDGDDMDNDAAADDDQNAHTAVISDGEVEEEEEEEETKLSDGVRSVTSRQSNIEMKGREESISDADDDREPRGQIKYEGEGRIDKLSSAELRKIDNLKKISKEKIFDRDYEETDGGVGLVNKRGKGVAYNSFEEPSDRDEEEVEEEVEIEVEVSDHDGSEDSLLGKDKITVNESAKISTTQKLTEVLNENQKGELANTCKDHLCTMKLDRKSRRHTRKKMRHEVIVTLDGISLQPRNHDRSQRVRLSGKKKSDHRKRRRTCSKSQSDEEFEEILRKKDKEEKRSLRNRTIDTRKLHLSRHHNGSTKHCELSEVDTEILIAEKKLKAQKLLKKSLEAIQSVHDNYSYCSVENDPGQGLLSTAFINPNFQGKLHVENVNPFTVIPMEPAIIPMNPLMITKSQILRPVSLVPHVNHITPSATMKLTPGTVSDFAECEEKKSTVESIESAPDCQLHSEPSSQGVDVHSSESATIMTFLEGNSLLPNTIDQIPVSANNSAEVPLMAQVSIDASQVTNPSSRRCSYWPNCRNSSCSFIHPSVNCVNFPNCPYGKQCIYIHPPCMFGDGCTNVNCQFLHISTPSAKVCKYYPNCNKIKCSYLHIDDYKDIDKVTVAPCRYGQVCNNPDCSFSHGETSTSSSLKWFAEKPHISERQFVVVDSAAVTHVPSAIPTSS